MQVGSNYSNINCYNRTSINNKSSLQKLNTSFPDRFNSSIPSFKGKYSIDWEAINKFPETAAILKNAEKQGIIEKAINGKELMLCINYCDTKNCKGMIFFAINTPHALAKKLKKGSGRFHILISKEFRDFLGELVDIQTKPVQINSVEDVRKSVNNAISVLNAHNIRVEEFGSKPKKSLWDYLKPSKTNKSVKQVEQEIAEIEMTNSGKKNKIK